MKSSRKFTVDRAFRNKSELICMTGQLSVIQSISCFAITRNGLDLIWMAERRAGDIVIKLSSFALKEASRIASLMSWASPWLQPKSSAMTFRNLLKRILGIQWDSFIKEIWINFLAISEKSTIFHRVFSNHISNYKNLHKMIRRNKKFA